MNRYLLLANLVLVIHAILVFFLVGGLVLIWVGYLRQWAWIRNPWIRLVHLFMMAFVVIQTLSGKLCPLTIWEYKLRVQGGAPTLSPDQACIPYWVSRVLFLDLPDLVFLVLYILFFLLFILSWCLIRPKWGKKEPSKDVEVEG
jgi:hypothetical protein